MLTADTLQEFLKHALEYMKPPSSDIFSSYVPFKDHDIRCNFIYGKGQYKNEACPNCHNLYYDEKINYITGEHDPIYYVEFHIDFHKGAVVNFNKCITEFQGYKICTFHDCHWKEDYELTIDQSNMIHSKFNIRRNNG